MRFRALFCLIAAPSLLLADVNHTNYLDQITPYVKNSSVALAFIAAGWFGYTYLQNKKKTNGTAKKRSRQSASVVYLFSHGIADTQKQALRYVKSYYKDSNTKITNTHYIVDEPWIAFDYPDATTNFWRINFNKMNLAQEADIATLKKAYDNVCKNYPNARIVLVGLSRGASTIINFIAEYKPDNIHAIILESPFDNVSRVIDHVLNQAKIAHASLIDMGQKIISWISRYKPHGIQPIHAINKFPHSIPVLFICSKEDLLVPAAGTIALHSKLLENGHPNAHLLILEKGKHGFLLSGPDASLYQSVAHAFYKHCNLTHDPALADQGEAHLHKKRFHY